MDKISEWIDWLRIIFAASTVEAYEWEMRALERWADRDVLELSRADLARYLVERRTLHQCGDASIKRSVNAIKSFYRFALGKRSPARDLRPGQTFRTVILPLALPGLAAGSVFTFSLTLGDYIIPSVVGAPGFFIGMMVYQQQGTAGNLPLAAAFAVVPIVLIGLYLALARQLGAFDAL